MSSRSTWKRHERITAKLFNTERNPLSGSAGKHTSSDTLHPDFYIECKYKSSGFTLIKNYFMDVVEKAKKENKIPILSLKEGKKKGFYLVIRAQDLKKICKHV